MNAIHFAGSDFTLLGSEVSPELLQALLDCARPGPADAAVAHVMKSYAITGNEADCAAYLKQYGAWEAYELANHETNLGRLVWLTGIGLSETGEAYFSNY